MKKYPPPQLLILLLVFLFSSLKIFAQTRTITGVVRDSANQPLASATVTVKGKKKFNCYYSRWKLYAYRAYRKY